VLLFVSMLVWSGSDLRVNLSGSIPLGIYRVVSEVPHRGSTVLLCLPKPIALLAKSRGYLHLSGNCPGRVGPVGKPVLALPGDTIVVVRDLGLFVNGVLIPNSRALIQDEAGRLLPRLQDGTYPVSPGQVWMASQYSYLSFDSRYFGPVATSSVQSVIRPIWTLENTPKIALGGLTETLVKYRASPASM
jgi:conjugative transfer signal peptidase TraF